MAYNRISGLCNRNLVSYFGNILMTTSPFNYGSQLGRTMVMCTSFPSIEKWSYPEEGPIWDDTIYSHLYSTWTYMDTGTSSTNIWAHPAGESSEVLNRRILEYGVCTASHGYHSLIFREISQGGTFQNGMVSGLFSSEGVQINVGEDVVSLIGDVTFKYA